MCACQTSRRDGSISTELQPAESSGVGPRPEPPTGAVRSNGDFDLRRYRPIVRPSVAPHVVRAVGRLKGLIHLEAAVVTVAGVGVPSALVLMDTEECVT